MDKVCEFTLRSIASKAMDDLKRVGVEIEKAIPRLTKSHGLKLCQVWKTRVVTTNEDEEWEAVKFARFYAPILKGYHDSVKIQDGLWGLALKALETYQSYFSEPRCFLSICLRNIHTGSCDYAFEFFFSSSYEYKNNPCGFLESLFLELERCLPSFRLSSGAQLGRQLLVVNVHNRTCIFNILASKKQEEEEDCKGRLVQRSKNMKFKKSLIHVADEIKTALGFLIESRGLTLCQVWMYTYSKNENDAIKLDGYCAPEFKDYYEACVNIQDGAGSLAVKTLVSYQPYFSRDVHALIPTTSASESSCCCLAICLKNIHTGEFDYVFEFFFPSSSYDNNNPCVFLESLFLALEKCLPSFKLSCGAYLGPQLKVLDGDNLEANFDFLALIKQEDKEEEEYDCTEDVEQQQFGTPNATNLNTPTNDNGAAIRATMDVPAFIKFADLKMKISQRFHLVSDAYRLSYLVKRGFTTGWLWLHIQDDQDLNSCIGYCKREKITRLLIRVLPCTHLN